VRCYPKPTESWTLVSRAELLPAEAPQREINQGEAMQQEAVAAYPYIRVSSRPFAGNSVRGLGWIYDLRFMMDDFRTGHCFAFFAGSAVQIKNPKQEFLTANGRE
jgi:hypothetical protein